MASHLTESDSVEYITNIPTTVACHKKLQNARDYALPQKI